MRKLIVVSLLVVSFLIAGTFTAFILLSSPRNSNNSSELSNNIDSELTFSKIMLSKVSNCVDLKENPKFNKLPIRFEEIEGFTPLGFIPDSEVFPVDYSSFTPKTQSTNNINEVYAVADATILNIYRKNTPKLNQDSENPSDNYSITFQVSCSYGYYYDSISKLSDELIAKIEKDLEKNSNNEIEIKVKEGDLIGYIEENKLNFGVYDSKIKLNGFLNPSSYAKESRRLHTSDPILSFNSELEEKINTLNPRSKEPFGGKIDYDQKGKLVGNYFKVNEEGKKGQISFVYDHIDTSTLILSIGDFNDNTSQFAVKDNLPDFSEIDSKNGLIKYELTPIIYIRKSGLPISKGVVYKDLVIQKSKQTLGVVLVQVIDDNSIKFEVFPGKTQNEIGNFTSKASVYVR